MKYIVPAIMYPSFFALIGYSVYLTGSAMPLFALLLFPSWPTKPDSDKPEAK